MGQQVLAIAVVFTITGSKYRAEQQEIKTPNASKTGIVHAIIKALKLTLTGIKSMQPLRKGLMIIHAVDIPTLHCFKITTMAWDGVMIPIPTMGENVFMGEPR